ncbi:MAG: sulfite oxidase [Pirellulales bacterium]
MADHAIEWLTGKREAEPLERRTLLKRAAAGLVAAAMLDGRGPLAAEPGEGGAGEIVAGKDRRLVVHNTKTVELETPLAWLRKHDLTPKTVLFVRNNQELPDTRTTEPAGSAGWTVQLAGLAASPRTFSAADLARMEQVEVEMVLQCSGNGRALFSRSAPAKGSQWQHGAMGNVRFGGVRLQTIVDALGLNVDPEARFLTAEGKDGASDPQGADFEHSIPLPDALGRSLLAITMNGEALPAVHGGPVRLVTPGYYGTMNIKWLHRLRFEARETHNHHQVRRYRTPLVPIAPGSPFEYGLANSEPNWRMPIKSVVFAPLEGERLAAGAVDVRGVAFNDGAARIVSVEVSTDGAGTWRRTELKAPASPYAWYHWRTTLTLPRGKQRLLARAIDAQGRGQPLDGAIGWNPAGYGWHGVHSVDFELT